MADMSIRHHLGRALLVTPATPSRIARLVVMSWILAMAGIWVVQQAHGGAHEHAYLPPLAHWLRDGGLAVPLAAISIMVGGLLALRATAVLGVGPGTRAGRTTWAMIAAALFALLSIPGNQVHAILFGAEEEDLFWLADVLLDGGVVLAASIAVLVPSALLGLAPWPADAGEPAAAPDPRVAPPPMSAALRAATPAPQRLGDRGVTREA